MKLFLASCVLTVCLPAMNFFADIAANLVCRDLREGDKDAFVSISFADAV